MRFRSLPPFALFTTIVGASLYSFSSPLFLTFVDSSFFQDPIFFNKFEDKDFVYKTSIKEDLEGTKDYFFNNSFNLYWKNNSNNSQSVVGNGFLLNILYPPEVHKGDPYRYSYRPKYYSSGEDLIFLIGTSFSFVKQLFTKINDWKSEVNESSNQSQEILLNEQSNFEFYFSHPYPDKDQRTGIPEQDYLYKLQDDNYYQSKEWLLNKPHYIKVEKKDVSVVYAAVDLQINKRLIDFPLRNSDLIYKELKDIHKKEAEWVDNIHGYKFATDFAVLQLKLKIKDLRGPFLEYLKKLYSKEGKIAKVPRASISVTDGKTNPIYLAGWSSLSEYEKQIHKFDNLFIEAKAKNSGSGGDSGNQINSKTPSEINSCNFSTLLDLNICESFESDKCSSSSSYEHTNLEFFPNDVDGVLFVSFQIKNKSTSFVYPKKKSVAYTGFKSGGATADHSETLSYYNLNQQEKNQRLKNFLAAKPEGLAKWKELEVRYGYFPFQNLRDHFNRVYYDPSTSGDINSSSPLDIFTLNGNKYVNISHQINIPNLEMSRSKGMMALMKDPEKKENIMVGMYEGMREWTNPFSLSSKSVGKIMLFSSPWRYDLFTKGNKLSKPTLADSLEKKNSNSNSDKLLDKLIYRNQFHTGLFSNI
ncbi:hypothetical protein HF1_00460 [Mycoplasma haemofelis str. Langford 1]|uniref:Uncharacterized protein n=1 Tax=Mycoplasma haemofelis (strain Langford 1) TaxID=941640 RepID=E8ZK88_MYCHL|nr:hypothetical protein [Mycoplasma haemofelis]CBY92054.1 hypothetical protein HF1_00460 [Mycoplasma haemofelis str. Langford 1]